MTFKLLSIFSLVCFIRSYLAIDSLNLSKSPVQIVTSCASKIISDASAEFNLLHNILETSRVNNWQISHQDFQLIRNINKEEQLQNRLQDFNFRAFNRMIEKYAKKPSRRKLQHLYHALHVPYCNPVRMTQDINIFHNQPPDSGDFPEAFIKFINQMYFIPIGDLRISAYQLNHPNIITAISELTNWIEPQRIKIILEEDYLQKDRLRNHPSNHITALKKLLEAGVEVRTDVSLQSRGNGQSHHKFALIGEDQLFTGSWNFTVRGTSRNYNHAFWIISEDLAKSYSHEFNQIWSGKSQSNKMSSFDYKWHELDEGKARALFAPQDPIKEAIIESLQRAKQSILVSLFFLTDLDLLKLLKAKKYAGVEVKLIIDNLGVGSKVGQIGKPLRDVLFDFGLDFWTDDSSGHWHHKIAIMDKQLILSGSANWSQSAFTKNDENLLQIEHQKLAEELHSIITEQSHFTYHKARKKISLPKHNVTKNYWQIYRENSDLKVKLPTSQHDIIVLFNGFPLDSLHSTEKENIFIKRDFYSSNKKEGLLSLYTTNLNRLDGVFINNGDGKLSSKSLRQIKSILVRNPKASCKHSIKKLESCVTPMNIHDDCISSAIGNWMQLPWYSCNSK